MTLRTTIRFIAVVAAGLLLAGCAVSTPSLQLAETNPANPDAESAPVPAQSTTLSIAPQNRQSPPAALAAPNGPSEHGAHSSGGRTSADASSHQPGAHQHGTSTTAPAGPATSPVVQLAYICPMHPDVMSNNPEDRCPKCSMKINKPNPKKAASAPASQPAAPATRPAATGHEGHTGGH